MSENLTLTFDADLAPVKDVLSNWQKMCRDERQGKAIDSGDYFASAKEETLVNHMRLCMRERGIDPSTVYPVGVANDGPSFPGLIQVTFSYDIPK